MSYSSDTSQRTMQPCALGLSSADLSAWRDEALAAAEMARIGAHRGGCPACQERLQGFEAIAATLRAQQAPIPDERLWQSVRAALSSNQPTASAGAITRAITVADQSSDEHLMPHPPMRRHSWRGRALGTLAAVAAITLVVVGFAQLFHLGAGVRQTQSFAVTWRQVTLPGGMDKKLDEGAALSVSPVDGSIAWLCQSGTKPTPGPLRVWRTSDGGSTWQALHVAQRDKAFDCEITPDQLDPDVVAISYGYIPSPKAITIQGDTLITFDGGASWRNAPLFQYISEFATLHGAIYAIRQNGPGIRDLAVSRDGMQTWTILDDTIHNQKLEATQFWVNPNTDTLLVRAISKTGDGAISLWTADANGGNWQQLIGFPPSTSSTVVGPVADGRRWGACVLETGLGSEARSHGVFSSVACGPDVPGGWLIQPGPGFPRWSEGATPTPCNGCSPTADADMTGAITLVGIANDGALLATAEDRFDAKGQATRVSLYRLPAGSNTWQEGSALPLGASAFSAGQLPSTVIYAPRPGGGMFWVMPNQDRGEHPSGPVFTASYPGPAAPPLPTQTQQTPTPVGNVDQTAPLAWQAMTNPTGFQPQFTDSNVLAVAPSDGRTAYACAQPNANPPAAQPQGWVTHDGGVSWSSLALPQVAGWCVLVVDQTNPRDVLMGFAHNPPQGILPDVYYRSTDGGASWRHVSSLDDSLVLQFATYHNTVYMARIATPLAAQATARLQASGDNMASWRSSDGGIRSDGWDVGQFWLNPYTGELLATNGAPLAPATPSSSQSALLWRSSDDGAHWRKLPAAQPGLVMALVQAPQPNHAWGICLATNPTGNNTLVCWNDSSQGWRGMPALAIDNTTKPIYTAITSDGALLAISATTTGSGATTYNVYRLPSGASRWQALGPTPEFSLLYAPDAPATGGDGMLWSVPVNGIMTDEQGRVFVAAAP